MTHFIYSGTLALAAIIFTQPSFAREHTVSIGEHIRVASEDRVKLKDSYYSVRVERNPGTSCAVPGFNCGSGYIPPHIVFISDCGKEKYCPFVAVSTSGDDKTADLVIRDEKSCEAEKHNSNICFYDFARQFKTDLGCSSLKSALGRYYCLEFYQDSKRPENKSLCDQLPAEIYALRWNCFANYAVRYRDPTFCDKYSEQDVDGKDRCYLKMAEIFSDQQHCKKISESKSNTYKEQCSKLKFR